MTVTNLVEPEPFVIQLSYDNAEDYNESGKPEQYRIEIPRRALADFSRLYYYSNNPDQRWLGVPMLKYPTDLLAYQRLIWELDLDLVVETGTFRGGSALYFATLFDAMGRGSVMTIDIEHREDFPKHLRISYLTGSSTDPAIAAEVAKEARERKVLLILDSDHRRPHVLNELFTYSEYATYIVVEDANINGHPVRPGFGSGPYEAIQEFLAVRPDWKIDRERIPLLTVCPNGYLRRV